MQNDPTLREVAQAFEVRLTAQTQAAKAWLHSLGDIRVGTLFTVFMLGLAAVLAVMLLLWLGQVTELIRQYRALGYPRLRALRLAQADIETERRQKHPPWRRQPPSRLAATPTQRETWAQDLEEERRFLS